MTTEQLIVHADINIDAPASKVWEVLVNPKYVAQWDELPEDYPSETMMVGSKVVWDLPDGGQSITRISKADPEKELVIELYSTSWESAPKAGEVAYRYMLFEKNGSTLLKIRIGDFSLIEKGRMYYEASEEFADNAKNTIKSLAESI